jgi:PD-(D/E)XK nuclease superfamily
MRLQRLSQGHLKTLQECPRKFEYIYLKSLSTLPLIDQQQTMEFGSIFHRLLHQQELGMPIEPFLATNPALESAMHGLQKAAPHLFLREPQIKRHSEEVRTFQLGEYLFTAIYDLLLLGETAQIIDWKTYGRPAKANQLDHDWQTRLYLYALVVTSDYQPPKISFTYWFVQNQPPQSVTFHYSVEQHHQTHQEISGLLSQLTSWLATGEPFPQVVLTSPLCEKCPFAARCQRSPLAQDNQLSGQLLEQLVIENIPEIPI